MAKHDKSGANLVPCTCNKCGVEALSFKGMQHRRCAGQPGVNGHIKPKHSKIPSGNRGIWE